MLAAVFFFFSLQPNSQVKNTYDALQLAACNVPPVPKNSHKILPPKVDLPIKSDTVDISVYVDANNGDDSNPGTADKPVKTIHRALDVYRSQKKQMSDTGMITLAAGEYFLTDTIDLTLDDSNLIFQGDKTKGTVISGGKLYSFSWNQYINKMSSPMNGINAIFAAVSNPGSSSPQAKYIGSMNSSDECEKACAQDNTCFAYTWHGPTQGAFAHMCYFRADGLWVPVQDADHISGKKLNIMVADLSKQDPIPFNTLFINAEELYVLDILMATLKQWAFTLTPRAMSLKRTAGCLQRTKVMQHRLPLKAQREMEPGSHSFISA